jgi:hypothetical protein
MSDTFAHGFMTFYSLAAGQFGNWAWLGFLAGLITFNLAGSAAVSCIKAVLKKVAKVPR